MSITPDPKGIGVSATRKYMKSLFKKIGRIIDLLLEDQEARKIERENAQQIENDRQLVEYAKAKKKLMPTGGVYSSNELKDNPINTGGDLIPMNLSDAEKALLREFYER